MTNAGTPAQTPVGALMHRGVINCLPQTPITEAAAQMAENGMHCMVVEGIVRGHGGVLADGPEELMWGIVSDRDLIRAAAAGELDADVDQIAATEVVTIDSDEPVERAIQLMSEHEISHLVVLAPISGEPIGVLSSLDIAGQLAAAAEAQAAAAEARGPVSLHAHVSRRSHQQARHG